MRESRREVKGNKPGGNTGEREGIERHKEEAGGKRNGRIKLKEEGNGTRRRQKRLAKNI